MAFLFCQEVDEDNPEHSVLTSGPTACRTKNDNSDEENESVNNVTNNTAAIERLGHIIANTSADIDNANHNNPLVFTNNDAKDLKSSFEEFSRNFVGYRGTRNNKNTSNITNIGLSLEECNHQLDNKPRLGETDNILTSISEGKPILNHYQKFMR